MGIALSGGADSAMLALHTAHWVQTHSNQTHRHHAHALHVHHGLQTPADTWRNQAQQLAQQLGLHWAERRVQVDTQGDGLESAARRVRYAALVEMARQLKLDAVLLAHHQDDQAETVLLRLLRGAGPQGLAAMQPCTERAGILFLRPWLDIPRTRILAQAMHYAQHNGWHAVHDPSNQQDAYTRGALRTRLAPHLDARWPGWQAVLARHARQSFDLAELLSEIAAQDFAALAPDEQGRSFSLEKWRALSPARQAQVLRYWLAQAGARMPSHARLSDLMRQMRQLHGPAHAPGHDRHLQLAHDGGQIRCVRGRMQWLPAEHLDSLAPAGASCQTR